MCHFDPGEQNNTVMPATIVSKPVILCVQAAFVAIEPNLWRSGTRQPRRRRYARGIGPRPIQLVWSSLGLCAFLDGLLT